MKAVFPGSFCPITIGHEDLVSRASKLFDEVIVLIMLNPEKEYIFSVEDRLSMAEKVFHKYSNVKIMTYEGLLADFVCENSIDVIIKGLRMPSDFEYENQMAMVNKKLSNGIETVFLIADEKFRSISSSMVRQIAFLHGEIKYFVPNEICDIILKKYKQD